MKVCLLSHADGRGGAYSAAYRLHQGLRSHRIDSTMLVGDKRRDDFTVLSPSSKWGKGWSQISPSLDALPKSLYSKRDRTSYSLQWLPERIGAKVAALDPDIINLHWINAGYLQIETIAKFRQPMVWTLHDMWAFTGGCHYSGECDRYTKSCGACPQLHPNPAREFDLSRWVWQRKAKAWKNLNLTIVTPSQWLADCARHSSLFQNVPIEVIANGLDIQKYKPVDRTLARNLLGLPTDKQIVLFGSINATSDRRKGFHLLAPALQHLTQLLPPDKVELVVFGGGEPQEPIDFGFKASYTGKLNDDLSLSLLYAAADVFVAPSLQDNLPNTLVESLACGTPCVAFNIGGIPDIIDSQQNGYLAQPFQVEDLARGISWILEDDVRHRELCVSARQKAEREFTLELQAQRYISIFEKIKQSDRYI